MIKYYFGSLVTVDFLAPQPSLETGNFLRSENFLLLPNIFSEPGWGGRGRVVRAGFPSPP